MKVWKWYSFSSSRGFVMSIRQRVRHFYHLHIHSISNREFILIHTNFSKLRLYDSLKIFQLRLILSFLSLWKITKFKRCTWEREEVEEKYSSLIEDTPSEKWTRSVFTSVRDPWPPISWRAWIHREDNPLSCERSKHEKHLLLLPLIGRTKEGRKENRDRNFHGYLHFHPSIFMTIPLLLHFQNIRDEYLKIPSTNCFTIFHLKSEPLSIVERFILKEQERKVVLILSEILEKILFDVEEETKLPS